MKHTRIGPYAPLGMGIPKLIEWLYGMGATTFQIYNGNPRALNLKTKHKWTPEEIKAIKQTGFPVFIHAPHLVHLAREKVGGPSAQNVLYDLQCAEKINPPGQGGVVIHLDSAPPLKREQYYQKLRDQINWITSRAPKKIRLLLEIPAGEKNALGYPYEEFGIFIQSLVKKLWKNQLGLTIDTAHIFGGGEDLRTQRGWYMTLLKIAKNANLSFEDLSERVHLVHLNDAGVELGACVDYHAPLGRGYWLGRHLGGNPKRVLEVLHWAQEFQVPLILETKGDYAMEVIWLQSLQETGKWRDIPKQANRPGQDGGAELELDLDLRERAQIIFEDMRAIQEMRGDRFRARAYNQILSELSRDPTVFDETHMGYWKGKRGVGKKLEQKLEEIMRTGTLQEWEDIRNDPRLESWKLFREIPGVGPSTAMNWIQLGYRDLDDLEAEPLTERQRFGIVHYDDLTSQIPLVEAKRWLRDLRGIVGRTIEVELMGGFRGGKKEGGDLDFILHSPQLKTQQEVNRENPVLDIVRTLHEKGWVIGPEEWLKGGWSGYLVQPEGKIRKVDLRFAPENTLAFWTLYFGSGEAWNRYLRSRAAELGMKLSQFGLFKRATGKSVFPSGEIITEENIFDKLGVEYVKPENRGKGIPLFQLHKK